MDPDLHALVERRQKEFYDALAAADAYASEHMEADQPQVTLPVFLSSRITRAHTTMIDVLFSWVIEQERRLQRLESDPERGVS